MGDATRVAEEDGAVTGAVVPDCIDERRRSTSLQIGSDAGTFILLPVFCLVFCNDTHAMDQGKQNRVEIY